MTDVPPQYRPAARVLCLDPAERLLLLKWRDPVGGLVFWEPPGGGIEPDETELQAARRELTEETGLPGEVVTSLRTEVYRDFHWNGRRKVGVETFFLGLVTDPADTVAPQLTPLESGALLERRWLSWPDITALPEPVTPDPLGEVLTRLHPTGPWAA
ncbi:MAG: NUDIX domain-containing protein [Micromonosporaceae bacterium]